MFPEWEEQAGGLYLKVISLQKEGTILFTEQVSVVSGILQEITRNHDAFFSQKSFDNNLRAINSGEMSVDFFYGKWGCGSQDAVCLGCSLGWHTYYFESNGNIVNARYTEDISLLKLQLRRLIKVKPAGFFFPDKGLAATLDLISMNRMQSNGIAYRFGEIDPENTTMVRQVMENNGIIGEKKDSAVLEIKNSQDGPCFCALPPISILAIMNNGILDMNNFFVSYTTPELTIRLIVTKGFSTASGKTRIDVRPWRVGISPTTNVLKAIIISALAAIRKEVRNREWQAEHMHIFIQKDLLMLNVFLSCGAELRVFGNKTMIPGYYFLMENAEEFRNKLSIN